MINYKVQYSKGWGMRLNFELLFKNSLAGKLKIEQNVSAGKKKNRTKRINVNVVKLKNILSKY